MFITLVHDLIPRTYGPGRTFASTLLALGTKILEAKINGFINQERKVGSHYSPFESWPQKGMNNAVPYPAHLAKPCPEKDRRNHHLVVSGVMGPGRITEAAHVFCNNTCNKTRSGIGKEAHGVADPVAAGKCIGRSPVLVNKHSDRICMIQFNGIALGKLVGIDCIGRKLADPNSVSP
jgi:hypothetical protein